MPTCTCRRCSIAADLPFALSAQRQRQRQAFMQRRRRQSETQDKHCTVDQPPQLELLTELEPEPEPEVDAGRDLESGANAELAQSCIAATSVVRALAGESCIDFGPLSIHLSAGAATISPAMAEIKTEFPDPASTQVHRLDVVSASECDEIVLLAEQYLNNGGQLTIDRHKHFPTTDIPVADVPALEPLCQGLLQSCIAPSVCEAYGLPPGSLLAHDLFIVYYSAEKGGQRGLAVHSDESHFSFNLLLSPTSDFDGGGTWFEHLNETITAEQVHSRLGKCHPPLLPVAVGQVVCHPGELRHKGVPITRGRRVLLVGFLQDRRRAMFDRPRENSMAEMQLNKDAGIADEISVLRTQAARVLMDEWEGHGASGEIVT